MVFNKIGVGSDFSFYGQLLRILKIDNNVIVLQDLRSDKIFTHGLETFRRTVKDAGFDIVV